MHRVTRLSNFAMRGHFSYLRRLHHMHHYRHESKMEYPTPLGDMSNSLPPGPILFPWLLEATRVDF